MSDIQLPELDFPDLSQISWVQACAIANAHARAAIELDRASRAVFDVEAMLVDTIPGGSICDPQAIADNIREYFEKHTPATPPAIDLSKLQRADRRRAEVTGKGIVSIPDNN